MIYWTLIRKSYAFYRYDDITKRFTSIYKLDSLNKYSLAKNVRLVKDEITNGVISRKEARDLQYDLLEFLLPEPTIVLNQPQQVQETDLFRRQDQVNVPPAIENSENNQDDVIELQPSRGFNIDSYTQLITQMHMYIQLLGQGILMARHNQQWEKDYFDGNLNILYKTDKFLFQLIESISENSLIEIGEVQQHACGVRHQAFMTPTSKVHPENQSFAILSTPVCQLFLQSKLFPFHQLYPKINKVWFDDYGVLLGSSQVMKSIRSKFRISPGHENLFFLYVMEFINKHGRKPRTQVELIKFLRLNEFMNNTADNDLVKMYKNIIRRKGNPIENYLSNGALPRENSIPIHNDSFINFTSTEEKLQNKSLGIHNILLVMF